MNSIYLLALGIGFVAGLRAMTAPAVVCWAAHYGCLNLHGSPLSFMGSPIAVGIFTLAAVAEYVNDVLPKTPSRTAPGPLIARIVTGGLSAACLCASEGHPLLIGTILGGVGAVIGTFGGYQARTRLVKALNVKDLSIAIPEDLIAISLAWALLCA